jgi:hypothetical protein
MRSLSLALVLSAFLVACGGGGGGGATAPVTPTAPVAVTYKASDWNATIAWWDDSLNASQSDTFIKGMIDNIKTNGYSGITFSYKNPVDMTTGHVPAFATTMANNTRMFTLMDYAYSAGLKVNIKEYWTIPSSDNVNQWTVNDAVNWYDAADPNAVKPYASVLLADMDTHFTQLASVAQAHHVSMIIMGSENDFLARNQYHSNWASMVTHLRNGGFTGTLTYDAIWQGKLGEAFYNVAIWDLMDKVCLSFFPDYSGTPLATTQDVVARWSNRTLADVTSPYADLNDPNTPFVSIVAELTQIKNQYNKEIIFGENAYENSATALMNWDSVSKLVADGVVNDPVQRQLAFEAELIVLSTPAAQGGLKGVVTGFNLMGYDPWEYGTFSTAGPSYLGLWKNWEQLMGTTAEATIKTYLQAGL